MKRISQRRYPAIPCKQCKNQFSPSDKRQVYCQPQHRIDHNNDLRAIKEMPTKLMVKKLFSNETILKKIDHNMTILNNNTFNIDFLLLEGFDFDISSASEINRKTGGKIIWSLSYGIEGIGDDEKNFIIHKK